MLPSSVAVGLEKPSYAAVFLQCIAFVGSSTIPSICSTPERSVTLYAVALALVVIWALRIYKGFGNTVFSSGSLLLFVLILVSTFASVVLLHRMTCMHLEHRIDANPSAWRIVEQGLATHRIMRNKKYDIFLPPQSRQSKSYAVGFLMLPGALVEHNAYAAVLSKLSDTGILVVIQNCEPMRLASESFQSTEQSLKAIIHQIKEQHGISAEKWSIGGHSMGGYTAMVIAKKTDYYASLVLYGVNKNYEIEKTAIRTLAITASNDGLQHSPMADISTFESWDKPEYEGRLHHVVIEGGNHSGFGDYPRQTFPLPDGERTILLEEQHRQIVEVTAKFLMPKRD